MDTIHQIKQALREVMMTTRKALHHKEKSAYDHAICEILKEIVIKDNLKVVHSYLPMRGEIDVTPLLKWLLENEVKVVCPKVLPDRELENLQLLHFDSFDLGPFNTFYPAGNVVYDGAIDLIIVPGLAFDHQKNRLGYGGGYYDKFMAKHPNAIKAAVLYPFQLLDKVPVEEHDLALDVLVTSDVPVRNALD